MTDIEPVARSLADQLTARIREAILTGAIPPGARLRVADLERAYGVSQIPVREAIRRLEVEALIETQPHRGARVASMSLRKLDDLYDLRRLIEVAVARRAVDRHSAETIAALQGDVLLLDQIYDSQDAKQFELVHKRFHWQLLAPGASEEIERTLLGIWQRTGRYVRLAMTAFGSGPRGQDQHHHLLQLVQARDSAAVAAELEEHLTLTQASIHNWYKTETTRLADTRPAGGTESASLWSSSARRMNQ